QERRGCEVRCFYRRRIVRQPPPFLLCSHGRTSFQRAPNRGRESGKRVGGPHPAPADLYPLVELDANEPSIVPRTIDRCTAYQATRIFTARNKGCPNPLDHDRPPGP